MDKKINTLVGAAYLGCTFTGIVNLIATLFPFLIGEFLPAGIFMIAAALSFGSLALALMKKQTMKRVIIAFVAFLVVACTPTRTSDSDTPIKAVYLVQGEGQLAQNDLLSHPEVVVTNNFDDLKKFARTKTALWIDINAVSLVDTEWFKEKPQRFYPVVLVGNGDELCSFMVTLWIVDLEGPGGYECNTPPPGFSVNIQVSDTGGNWHGYKQTPTVQGILDITNPLLEGVK